MARSWCVYRLLEGTILSVSLIVLIPVILGVAAGVPVYQVTTLIVSTVVLQAAAAVVGVGLQIHPVLVVVVTTSVAIGVMILILTLCDLFAEQSKRIQAWLHKIEQKTSDKPYIKRYGPVMLIPIIWIPGISLYGSPFVAWLLGWKRWKSIICMTIGWIIACIVVLETTLGIVTILR